LRQRESTDFMPRVFLSQAALDDLRRLDEFLVASDGRLTVDCEN
jgi:hypothetical protein